MSNFGWRPTHCNCHVNRTPCSCFSGQCQPGHYPPSAYPNTRVCTEAKVCGSGNYHWQHATLNNLPSRAFIGGTDIDGQAIFVGKAMHNNDWLPAKVIPGKNAAYVSYGGQEIQKYDVHVLCGDGLRWVHSSNGRVPPRAIEGGRTSNGEVLYIGRVNHQGSWTIGKVHPSHRVCYIPFGGKEHKHSTYEVLVY